MGELAEDFALMKKVRAEERAKREPSRINYVANKLMQIGCTIAYNDWEKCVFFEKTNKIVHITKTAFFRYFSHSVIPAHQVFFSVK